MISSNIVVFPEMRCLVTPQYDLISGVTGLLVECVERGNKIEHHSYPIMYDGSVADDYDCNDDSRLLLFLELKSPLYEELFEAANCAGYVSTADEFNEFCANKGLRLL